MLTKISMWDDQHGWRNITISEAAKKYPIRVQKSDQVFLCELCNQYVAFAKGPLRTYFTHTKKDSQYCKQKTTSYSTRIDTNPLEFSLPLRVKLIGNSIDLSIGFLPLPHSIMESAEKANAQVSIFVEEKRMGTYRINPMRFDPNRTTYYSVNDNICEQYELAYDLEDIKLSSEIKHYWPKRIDGIHINGTLFDADSGKRLPSNADVVVGRQYLLITQKTNISSPGVAIEQIDVIGQFVAYRVCASEMSKCADEFFRRYGGRLTDNPAELTEVYPFAIKSPHTLRYCADQAWFYKSDGFVDIYPANQSLEHKKQFFAVKSGFEQILSISRFENRTSVLRYVMIRKVDEADMPVSNRIPDVKVLNDERKLVHAGVYFVLPKGRVLSVEAAFDGRIDVLLGDLVVNRIALKGGKQTSFDVGKNRTYRIYQGLDCVYELTFASKKAVDNMLDAQVFRKLISYAGQPIAITHAFGVIAARLGNMPRTKAWLATQIRNGQIDRRAKAYLQHICVQ